MAGGRERGHSRAEGAASLIETSKVVSADPEALLPDGLHRSAEGHSRVAEVLADAIASRFDSGGDL